MPETFRVTETGQIWIPDHIIRSVGSCAKVLTSIAEGKSALAAVSIIRNLDMSNVGWIAVGTAHITADLIVPESLTAQEVHALRQQLDSMRQHNRAQEAAMQDRIAALGGAA